MTPITECDSLKWNNYCIFNFPSQLPTPSLKIFGDIFPPTLAFVKWAEGPRWCDCVSVYYETWYLVVIMLHWNPSEAFLRTERIFGFSVEDNLKIYNGSWSINKISEFLSNQPPSSYKVWGEPLGFHLSLARACICNIWFN